MSTSERPSTAARRAAVRRESITSLVDLLLTWHERVQQRRCLASLPDSFLADCGLSRCDVDGESRKPFWRD
ncbi:DUF1127 domain-containing protein [Inquilinus sp. Marseille-Q2685]|uniref:DUF1127 domain-containing protein n=1 Tax=Inquilinus sp. Marseille-Q2685 TaxID=2866581 RepID=UPI001CE3C0C3|nr:DUF1127 domain-containing protein [Inquilinus sp. Marseille-Q2685]